MELGLLTDLDLAVLGAYCASYQPWIDAEEVLAEVRMRYVTPTGQVERSPYVQIARDSMNDKKAIAAEFGISPSSRGRLSIPLQQQTDDTEEFLFGNRNTSLASRTSRGAG